MTLYATAQINTNRGWLQNHYPIIRRTADMVTVNVGTSHVMPYTTRQFRITADGALFAPVTVVDAVSVQKTKIEAVEAEKQEVTVTKNINDEWYLDMEDDIDDDDCEYEFYTGYISNATSDTDIEIDDEEQAELVCNLLNKGIEYREAVKVLTAEVERLKALEAEHDDKIGEQIIQIGKLRFRRDKWRAKAEAAQTEIDRLHVEHLDKLLPEDAPGLSDRLSESNRQVKLLNRKMRRKFAKIIDDFTDLQGHAKFLKSEVERLEAENAALREQLAAQRMDGDWIDATEQTAAAPFGNLPEPSNVERVSEPDDDHRVVTYYDDYTGFTFTRPVASAPVRFFDDDAIKALEVGL